MGASSSKLGIDVETESDSTQETKMGIEDDASVNQDTNERYTTDLLNNTFLMQKSVILMMDNYKIDEVIELLKPHLASVEDIAQINFSKKNEVTITFKTELIRNQILQKQIIYQGETVCVIPVEVNRKVFFLKDVCGEIEDNLIKEELNKYGKVLNFIAFTLKKFPFIRTATRKVTMLVEKQLPLFLLIYGMKIPIYFETKESNCTLCNLPVQMKTSCQNVVCLKCRGNRYLRLTCPENPKNEEQQINEVSEEETWNEIKKDVSKKGAEKDEINGNGNEMDLEEKGVSKKILKIVVEGERKVNEGQEKNDKEVGIKTMKKWLATSEEEEEKIREKKCNLVVKNQTNNVSYTKQHKEDDTGKKDNFVFNGSGKRRLIVIGLAKEKWELLKKSKELDNEAKRWEEIEKKMRDKHMPEIKKIFDTLCKNKPNVEIKDICWNCGKEAGHFATLCDRLICTKCGQEGHLDEVCFISDYNERRDKIEKLIGENKKLIDELSKEEREFLDLLDQILKGNMEEKRLKKFMEINGNDDEMDLEEKRVNKGKRRRRNGRNKRKNKDKTSLNNVD